MATSTMILVNIGAGALLALAVAGMMLLPTRLHRHFATGHTHRQRRAWRRQLQAAGAHARPHRSAQRGLRPLTD